MATEIRNSFKMHSVFADVNHSRVTAWFVKGFELLLQYFLSRSLVKNNQQTHGQGQKSIEKS